MAVKTARRKWQELTSLRTHLERKWANYAKLTLPYLYTDEYYREESDDLQVSSQSEGARGTNSLANKLMMTLFDVSQPFFRFQIDKASKVKLIQAGMPETAIQEVLAKGEAEVFGFMSESNLRPKLYEVLKNLIALGNVMLYMPASPGQDSECSYLSVKNYVVKRSESGVVIEAIVRRPRYVTELTDEVAQLYRASGKRPLKANGEEGIVYWYEWLTLEGDKYLKQVWIDDLELPVDYHEVYPKDNCPYNFLTWVLPAGNDYGVGMTEDNYADLVSLDINKDATHDLSDLIASHKWLLSPNSELDVADVESSGNGSVHVGNKDDLTLVQSSSMSTVLNQLMLVGQGLTQDIAQAYLRMDRAVRDAERVTAEEIRRLANELETSLGGAYTRLGVDLQLPVAKYLIAMTRYAFDFGKGSSIKPVMVTGLDALNRNVESERLERFISKVASLANAGDQVLGRLRLDNVLSALAAAERLSASEYVMSDAEYKQNVAMQQQANMQQQQQLMATQGVVDQSVQAAGAANKGA